MLSLNLNDSEESRAAFTLSCILCLCAACSALTSLTAFGIRGRIGETLCAEEADSLSNSACNQSLARLRLSSRSGLPSSLRLRSTSNLIASCLDWSLSNSSALNGSSDSSSCTFKRRLFIHWIKSSVVLCLYLFGSHFSS